MVKNNNRSNKQKKQLCTCSTLFLYISLPLFARLHSRQTSRNFLVTRLMEEMSYVFSFTFFSLPFIFTLHWWPPAFPILSSPLKNFHVVFQQINVFVVFISRSRPLSPFLFFSVFLLLYNPNLWTSQLI